MPADVADLDAVEVVYETLPGIDIVVFSFFCSPQQHCNMCCYMASGCWDKCQQMPLESKSDSGFVDLSDISFANALLMLFFRVENFDRRRPRPS